MLAAGFFDTSVGGATHDFAKIFLCECMSLGSAGSFLVKEVSVKNDANWPWLASLARFLSLVIFVIPFFTPTEDPGPRVFAREKEVTWSVRPGMPLLEFSG